jgi:hypothetical protein
MVNLGSIFWSVEVANAQAAASDAAAVQEQMGETAEKAQRANSQTNKMAGSLSTVSDSSSEATSGMGRFDRTLGSFKSSAGLATTAIFFLRRGISKLLGLVPGGGLGALLSVGGGVGLGKIVTGASLGSLVSKVALSSLLKALPALGALVIAADTIGAMIDGEDPITAFVTAAEDMGEFILNPIGIDNDLIEAVTGIGVFILGTMSIASFLTGVSITAMVSGAGATIATFLGWSSITALVAGAGSSLGAAGTTIAAFLGFASMGALVTTVGSIAALIASLASLGDLVDGDISSWNLPAKFGYALGQGFRDAWPDMAAKIRNAFTNNPVHGAGEFTGNVMRGEGRGAVTGENRGLSADAETGFIDPSEVPGLSQAYGAGQGTGNFIDRTFGAAGGAIGATGRAVIHEGEQLIPADTARMLEDVNFEALAASAGNQVVQPEAPAAPAPGGTGGSEAVTIKEVSIELGDQSLDLRDLTRSDIRRLASELAPELGREVENIISP